VITQADMRSTPNLICGLHIKKGKTLLILSYVCQGQRSLMVSEMRNSVFASSIKNESCDQI